MVNQNMSTQNFLPVEARKNHYLYQYENNLYNLNLFQIAGVDEAGRGPLAGPVVAGAVILPRECTILGLNDSKKIGEKKRYILEKEIKNRAAAWAIGAVGAQEIDKINIFQATLLAMRRAINNLKIKPEHILIDAMELPDISISQTSIIKGDAKSASIAAASIVAKCHRDRVMVFYDHKFPEYGFSRHKGYPTPEHRAMILKYGTTCIHRTTFHVKI